MKVKRPLSASRFYRLQAGVSLEEAAARAKISPAWLRQKERGQMRYPFNAKHRFTALAAARLAHLYGCSQDVFLPGYIVYPSGKTGASGVPASISNTAHQSEGVAAPLETVRGYERARASKRYSRPRVPVLTIIAGGNEKTPQALPRLGRGDN